MPPLNWQQLPHHAVLRGEANALAPATAASDPLKNPSVNTIIAHGRTSQDVQADLRAFREKARARQQEGDERPIFQNGYYLCVQLNGTTDVVLHRVVHGIFVDDTSKKDVNFTTLEYVHSPQPGCPGLLGTFHAKENPHFDPKDAKSGN
eukprot:4339742-Pleurochrysis_carterae.AAC.1